MKRFNGTVKVRVGEAVDLQPTKASTRHAVALGKAGAGLIGGGTILDPYVVVRVDEHTVGQTRVKQRTNAPTYNEEFSVGVDRGERLEFAVFHQSPIGYDDFICHCTIQFQDLRNTESALETFEGWVSHLRFACSPGSALGFLRVVRFPHS